MLATRQSLRLVRLQCRRPLPSIPRPQLRLSHTQRTFATTPQRRQKPDTENDESIREEYVRTVREKWGNNLPEDLLTPKELAMYERHYGKPVRMLKEGENPLKEWEEENSEVDGELEMGTVTLQDQDGEDVEILEAEQEEEGLDDLDPVAVEVQSPDEAKGYEQLQRDMEKAFSKKENAEEFYMEGEIEDDDGFVEDRMSFRDDGSHTIRTHPLTSIGRFATFPSTVRLPPAVQQPTMELLSDVPNKHLDEAACRIFGDRQLPDSPVFTGRGGKALKAVLLDVEDTRMSDIGSQVWLATVLPGYYSQSLSALTELRRRLGGDWVLGNGGEGGVKSILDVGAGGAGVLAWKSIIEAERERRQEERERTGVENQAQPVPEPNTSTLKASVVTASEPLRYRMSKFLDNTTFLPRIPDRNQENVYNSPSHPPVNFEPNQKQPRKVYDLIIATNNMLPLKENHHKRDRLKKLWSHLNPNGGVLLLIEKGTPNGFEAIAGARATLLRNHISSEGSEFRPIGGNTGLDIDDDPIEKEVGAIIAPCTNHKDCPMFPKGYTNGIGRKDWCHFSQRYERPIYLQRIMGEGRRNHDDLLYSYVAVRRGVDYRREKNVIDPQVEEFKLPNGWGEPTQSPYSMEQLRRYAFTLPRSIFPPLKRHRHVILDLCTPEGQIERWTVPKSLSKIAYRDARKSKWGDLWALGGKSKTPRNIKVGGGKEPPKVTRVIDDEGNVTEKVSYTKRAKARHWSRGDKKLGEMQEKIKKQRREIRWSAREKEMELDREDTY